MRGLAITTAAFATALAAAPEARAFELPQGINFGVGFENGSHQTAGPYKALSYIQFTDRLGVGETLKLSSSHSADFEELNTVMADLTVPLNERWFVSANGAYSETHPGGATGDVFDEDTTNLSFGATLNRYLYSTDTLVAILTGGVATADVETYKDSILMPPVALIGIPYIPNESYQQRTRDAFAQLAVQYDPSQDLGIFGSLTVSQGVDVHGPEHFRMNVDDTPTVVSASARVTQNLPETFQVVLRGEVQWTADRLNQQKMFTLGGADYATGYKSSERIGDIGGGFHFELNKLGVVSVPAIGELYYKPFIFVDGGFTRINNPFPSETRGYRAEASAGVGIAFEASNGLHLGVQAAWPLTGDSVFGDDDDEPRILFSVGFKK